MQVTGGRSWTTGRKGDASHSFRNSPLQGRGEDHRAPFCVQLIDVCLLSLLFIAPLLMGGRHPVGQLAWILIASVLGLATVLHYRPAKPAAGDVVWLAAGGLVVLQLIPMPGSLLTWLNPGLSELLPAITDPASLPLGEAIYSGRPISLNPYRTRLALGMLLAYGVIFHSITRRVQTTADVRRLLAWIAIATVAISLLALAQRFAGNGKFLWVYQHISRSASDVVKGPFQNQNHLAQLMALGLGPLLFFATSQSGHWRTVLATSGTTLCLLTGLLTFSRGGAIAIATAGLVAMGGLACIGHVNRQRWLRLAVPALVTVVLLGVWGGERLLTRVETLAGGSGLSQVAPGRIELWQSHLRAIAASPWVGYGAASHEDIYPAFIDKDFGVNFTHGESGYLPIQLENGLLGTILLVGAIWLAAWWAWQCLLRPTSGERCSLSGSRDHVIRGLSVACLAGLAASAVQSVADFVWYIPACLTPTLMLLACLYRLASLAREVGSPAVDSGRRSTNIPWLTVPVAVLVVAATWGVGPARADHLWQRFRTMTRETAERAAEAPSASCQETIPLLEAIIHHNPSNPTSRFRLAAALLLACDEPNSIRGPVKERLLATAIRHTIIGLGIAPLRGEGYVLLADSYRRAGSDSELQLALLEQAVRVRRSDTDLCFKAGLAALRGGHVAWGLEAWRPVLEVATPKRDRFLRLVADHLPAPVLLQSFSLDHAALTIMYYRQRASDLPSPELVTHIGQQLVDSLIQAAEDNTDHPTKAASFLHRANRVLEQIDGPPDEVLALASRAVAASSSDYPYRIRLAALLIRAGRWKDGAEHLRWCQTRKPFDPEIARQKNLLLQRSQQL